MDENLVRRLKSISDLGRVRGVCLDVESLSDPIVQFVSSRRMPDVLSERRRASDKRLVAVADMLRAIKHTANIYHTSIHIKVGPYDDVALIRKTGFHNNLLCELSDGSRLEIKGRLFTYVGESNGTV